MPKIQAVVFDVDGTLLNTFEHIIQAFEVVLPQHGVKPDREAIRTVIGKTLIDCYRTLVPQGDHEAMKSLHHETQQTPEMYALIVAYDDLRKTLEEIRAKGIKTAVLTNRSRVSIDLIFEHIGIADLFDIIVTFDDVQAPKPDTRGLEYIASGLKVSTPSIVIVGDTHIDTETGKRGGVAATIGITHGFGTREELEAAGTGYLIDSFAELSEIIDRIEQDD